MLAMEQRTKVAQIPPAATILAVLALLFAVPHHIEVLPMWMSHAVALAILVPMAAIAFARTNVARWLRVERTMIQFFAEVYVLNTAAELADMVGIITLHRPETRAVSLLSSSLAIWVTNVLAFGLVYWQIDRGGPYAKATGTQRKPDWTIPAAGVSGEDRVPDWRPRFVDYLFLALTRRPPSARQTPCRLPSGRSC